MHISKLQLVNYRNFANADVLFNKGVNTIIGENGSGKTNLFRAIRLLLDDNMLRMAYKLDEKDFHRGLGNWRGHWIIISLEFDDVSQDESIQSLFLHGAGNIDNGKIGKATYNLIFRPKAFFRVKLLELEKGDNEGLSKILNALFIEDYETIFTGKSTADFTDPKIYKELVGDFENVLFNKNLDHPSIGVKIPAQLSISKEISFTFIQALRDVVSDFQSNRTNPLLTLLKSKSGDIQPGLLEPIITLVKDLNTAIEGLQDVTAIRNDIRDTIKDAAGETYSPLSLSIQSDLSDEADRLFQSLKLFVGESDEGYEGAITELSLGGANLIYLTLKLLEFKYQKIKQSFANFLLIEEPEAHIHTHIQKTLFDKLNYPDTQVIYSTHSTQISEVSNVQSMNVLGRIAGKCEVYQPSRGLSFEALGNIQRYLDAVRSNLLFAKSVLLAEGDSEEILIPILVKKVLGISLDELGISLINIRSTGFENVALLFHNNRIRKRCSIITDLDAAVFNTTPPPVVSPDKKKAQAKAISAQKKGIARQVALEEFCAGNSWVRAFYAPHTFEIDFITAGNAAKIVGVLNTIYTDAVIIDRAKKELESNNIELYGKRVLVMANNVGKGWFAILVGKTISPNTIIPNYILDAIFFAHGIVSRELIFKILKYRLHHIIERNPFGAEKTNDFGGKLEAYRNGNLDLNSIRNAMLTTFPTDEINAILARL